MSVVWIGVENDIFWMYEVKFWKIFGWELTLQVLTPPVVAVQIMEQVMTGP